MATVYRQLTLEQAGQLLIDQLPFPRGTAVEIIIRSSINNDEKRYPLRGSNYQYNNPFEPTIPLEEWESLQ